jgi:hypothetical protein
MWNIKREMWLAAVARKCDFIFVFHLNLSGYSLQYPVTETDSNAMWTRLHKHMKVTLKYLYGHFVRLAFHMLNVSTVQTSTKLRYAASHSFVIYWWVDTPTLSAHKVLGVATWIMHDQPELGRLIRSQLRLVYIISRLY